MAATNSTKTVADSLARDWLNAARSYLGGRRVLLIAAAVIVAGGLALNWSWLVAAGIAPLLIGVLPCVAMCALGLCMHKIGGRSCQSDKGNRTIREPWPKLFCRLTPSPKRRNSWNFHGAVRRPRYAGPVPPELL